MREAHKHMANIEKPNETQVKHRENNIAHYRKKKTTYTHTTNRANNLSTIFTFQKQHKNHINTETNNLRTILKVEKTTLNHNKTESNT